MSVPIVPDKFIKQIAKQMKRLNLKLSNEGWNAFKNVPREYFVRDKDQKRAYDDKPLYIESGQTISAPHMYAIMLSNELMDPSSGMNVLEIGTGSGYGAALIAKLAPDGNVITVERHKDLVDFASENLLKAGIQNVSIIHGDGTSLLFKEKFDRIIITAAGDKLPGSLLDCLTETGRIIMPIIEQNGEQWLYLITKSETSEPDFRRLIRVAFVPLIYDEIN